MYSFIFFLWYFAIVFRSILTFSDDFSSVYGLLSMWTATISQLLSNMRFVATGLSMPPDMRVMSFIEVFFLNIFIYQFPM